MLQILMFAPYVALAASLLLAGTVAMICCLPRYEAAPAAGFTPRAHKRAVMSEATGIYSAPRRSSGSPKKSAVLVAAA